MDQDNTIPISEEVAYMSRVYIGVTVPLLILCLAAFMARLQLRIRRTQNIKLDDWFILIGFILTIVDWALLLSEMFTTPCFISEARATRAIQLALAAIPVWSLAMTFIKVAVAITLLRFQRGRLWAIFLYTIIGVANAIFILLSCRPLAAYWDISYPRSDCLPTSAIVLASNISLTVNIVTDLLLSLSPATFLWKVNRPFREKVLVCCLMALGLLASVASINKAIIVNQWDKPTEDPWALAIVIGIWTILEPFVGVLAACLSCLKPVFQRVISYFGVSLTAHRSHISFLGGPRSRFTPSKNGGSPHDEKEDVQCEKAVSSSRFIDTSSADTKDAVPPGDNFQRSHAQLPGDKIEKPSNTARDEQLAANAV